jgi:hypothetical protein
MSGGKAYGVNRQYQETCRDVLVHRSPRLIPWANDGIDVPFTADTTWTLDVALKDDLGRLVVAECRRTIDPVKQDDIGAFAHKVEQLRKTEGVEVAGVFFTKTKHQKGAVRVGQSNGIDIVVLAENAEPPAFGITYLRYDAERERTLAHTFLNIRSEGLGIKGELFAALIQPAEPES